jgi:hypothetical protein
MMPCCRVKDAIECADQLVALAQRMTAHAGTPLPAMANRGDLSARIARFWIPNSTGVDLERSR